MNLRSRKFKIEPCYVCGYLFTDRHHFYPTAKFTKKLNRATIPLCPNHHRYANIVQALLVEQCLVEDIRSFAEQHFDADFNEKVLDLLVERYQAIEQRLHEHASGIFELLFGGFSEKEPE